MKEKDASSMALSFDLKSLVASLCIHNLQLSAQNMWNLREGYFQISKYIPAWMYNMKHKQAIFWEYKAVEVWVLLVLNVTKAWPQCMWVACSKPKWESVVQQFRLSSKQHWVHLHGLLSIFLKKWNYSTTV